MTAPATGEAVLRVSGLDVYYGRLPAVQDVSLEVREGEIVALVGPNGAGKTTVMKAIIGLVKPRRGRIEFRRDGRWIEIQDLPVHTRVRLGIHTVAAVENVLPRFTVERNLRIGAYTRDDDEIERDLERQLERFPILRQRRAQLAGTLSGGEQKMLAIGRALMGRPGLLLLDEPSLGLAGRVMDEVFDIVTAISREQRLEVLLVEQNVRKGLESSARTYVMRIGAVDFEAPSAELLEDDRIEQAYFGGAAAPAAPAATAEG